MATRILSQHFPNEIIDIIMKKTHQLNIKDLHNEFELMVYNNKVEKWGDDGGNIDIELYEYTACDPFDPYGDYNKVFGFQVPKSIHPRDHHDYIESWKQFDYMTGY